MRLMPGVFACRRGLVSLFSDIEKVFWAGVRFLKIPG